MVSPLTIRTILPWGASLSCHSIQTLVITMTILLNRLTTQGTKKKERRSRSWSRQGSSWWTTPFFCSCCVVRVATEKNKLIPEFPVTIQSRTTTPPSRWQDGTASTQDEKDTGKNFISRVVCVCVHGRNPHPQSENEKKARNSAVGVFSPDPSSNSVWVLCCVFLPRWWIVHRRSCLDNSSHGPSLSL